MRDESCPNCPMEKFRKTYLKMEGKRLNLCKNCGILYLPDP